MADIINAEILFKDSGGVIGKCGLRNIPSASAVNLTKLLALATSLRSYTSAGVTGYSLLTWAKAAVADTATPAGLNTVKAVISLYWEESGVPTYSKLYIPNPNCATHFEMIEGQGLRMKAASLTAIEGLLSALSGKTITCVEGKIETRTFKRQASPSGTCLVFQDEQDFRGFATLPTGWSIVAANLATFATAMATGAYSNSKLISTYLLAKQEVELAADNVLAIPDADTLPFGAVETRMTVKCNYTAGTQKKSESISLPGVKGSVCIASKDSYKLSMATGQGVALALTSFYGAANKSLVYRGSRFKATDYAQQG